MKILLAASEAVPFCKTGGLADVVGALSQKLGASGHDVCLFLPKYRAVESAALQGGIAQKLAIPLGGGKIEASLRYMQWRNVSVYFIDHPAFFDREGLYTRDGKDHADNAQRFAFFSRGVLEGAKLAGFRPDVLHCHDWQTGLIPAYLKRHYKSDPFFERTASLLTVHNMAYQGNFPHSVLKEIGLGEEDFTPDKVEYYGQVSYLKAGLVFADSLTTVSPTYAREIQESDERGFGLEGLLQHRTKDLHGILNGIDVETWNPEKDHFLAQRYGARDAVGGKAACKRAVRPNAYWFTIKKKRSSPSSRASITRRGSISPSRPSSPGSTAASSPSWAPATPRSTRPSRRWPAESSAPSIFIPASTIPSRTSFTRPRICSSCPRGSSPAGWGR